jgi:hypothetical protein
LTPSTSPNATYDISPSSITSALPVFTGAATLPIANLALLGMGLLGAFHGLA